MKLRLNKSRRFLGLCALTVNMLACVSMQTSVDADKATYDFAKISAAETPEDLVALPDSNWVLVSSIAEHNPQNAGYYAVNRESHAVAKIFPESLSWGSSDDYADCPGKPDLNVFGPHGINAFKTKDGQMRMLAVNHGGREAIEVFDINYSEEADLRPQLTWIGCVIMPADVHTNGVAATPDGGLVATKMIDKLSETGEQDMISGAISGYVLHWTAEQGWKKIDGPDLPAPNGIEVTHDGEAVIVASWTARKMHRFPLGDSDVEPASIDVDFMPDNVRIGSDGRLLITGQDATPMTVISCAKKAENCTKGFSVVEIDPITMQAETLYKSDTPEFMQTTVALSLGDEVWVGTLNDSDIAQLKKK